MTYQKLDDTEAETGRRTDGIEITAEMIEAGERELVFDSELIRSDVVWDVVTAVLEAGGYVVTESVSF